MLTVDDLLAGGQTTPSGRGARRRAAPREPRRCAATRRLAPAGDGRTVVIRPLVLADVQRIQRAARDDQALTSVLMVQQALVEPTVTVEQVNRMHAGLVELPARAGEPHQRAVARRRRARRHGAGADGARLLRAVAGVRLDPRGVRGADGRTGAPLPRDARARRGNVGAMSPTANGDVVAGDAAGHRVRPGGPVVLRRLRRLGTLPAVLLGAARARRSRRAAPRRPGQARSGRRRDRRRPRRARQGRRGPV